jgi:hypothetical protein
VAFFDIYLVSIWKKSVLDPKKSSPLWINCGAFYRPGDRAVKPKFFA